MPLWNSCCEDGRGYFELLELGDSEQQPGAGLNAMRYLRNAKIFAKLTRVVQPGDRILMVYSAGHNYWLRRLVKNTPGYELVDVRPYLAPAEQTN